jgi:hypothetical protein
MSAQSCVQNLVVNLNGSCEATVTPAMVIVGSSANLRLKINDNNPTDDDAVTGNGKVNAVSPATGWSYGVFNTTNGQLVCQGTIIVADKFRPVFTDSTAKHWKLIDTIVTWADNLDDIYNVAATYGSIPTDKANRFYTGRPWLVDSCELNVYGVDTSFNVAGGAKIQWMGIRLNARRNNPDTTGGLVDSIGRWPITIANMQLKVTDYLESPQCDSVAFAYKLRRSFQFIDRRGNDTTLNQIIYFQRPANRGSELLVTSRSASTTRDGVVNSDTINRGPGNLGQFGPFGASIKRRNITYNGSTPTYVDRMTILGSVGTGATYTKARYNGPTVNGVDTFQFNIQGTSCVVPPSTEAGHKALLRAIYVAKDSTPIGAQDSVSLFDDVVRTRFNYSVSFETTTFDACNGGKKFQYITSVFDWCGGGIEKDTIIVKFEDLTAPTAAAKSATAGTGDFVGKIRGRRIGTTNAKDSVIISVGTNDCTASLRLPAFD